MWFPPGRDHNGGQGSSHPHHLSRAIVIFGQTLACCDVPYNACLLVSLPACPDPSQTLKTHLITPSSVLCDTELPTPPHSHFYISLYALFPPLKIPTQAAPSLWSPEPTSRQFPPQNVCLAEFPKHQSIHTCRYNLHHPCRTSLPCVKLCKITPVQIFNLLNIFI